MIQNYRKKKIIIQHPLAYLQTFLKIYIFKYNELYMLEKLIPKIIINNHSNKIYYFLKFINNFYFYFIRQCILSFIHSIISFFFHDKNDFEILVNYLVYYCCKKIFFFFFYVFFLHKSLYGEPNFVHMVKNYQLIIDFLTTKLFN